MFTTFLLIALPTFYLLPSLLLTWREVPGAGMLFLVNLLLGWTVLPWLYLLGVGLWPRERTA